MVEGLAPKPFVDEIVAIHDTLRNFVVMLSQVFPLVMPSDATFDFQNESLLSLCKLVKATPVQPLSKLPAFASFVTNVGKRIFAILERTLDADGRLDHPVRVQLLHAFAGTHTVRSLWSDKLGLDQDNINKARLQRAMEVGHTLLEKLPEWSVQITLCHISDEEHLKLPLWIVCLLPDMCGLVQAAASLNKQRARLSRAGLDSFDLCEEVAVALGELMNLKQDIESHTTKDHVEDANGEAFKGLIKDVSELYSESVLGMVDDFTKAVKDCFGVVVRLVAFSGVPHLACRLPALISSRIA